MNLTIADVIANKEDVYEGNLEAYLRIILEQATNLKNPYHNMRHMLCLLYTSPSPRD